jgi:probable phosphoglycerate mutase
MSDLDWELETGVELVLIRHGETEWNRDQRIQGHLDIALSRRGEEQARLLLAALEAERPPVLFTSDLGRAAETAAILAQGQAEVILDSRLREANLGAFQGKNAAEIEAEFPEAYHAWRRDSARNRPPGGETLVDLRERCMAGLRDALGRRSERTVWVVAHGGPIRVMACGLLGLPLEAYGRLRVENTAVARFLYRPAGFMLAGWNDISHLKASTALPGHSGWEER